MAGIQKPETYKTGHFEFRPVFKCHWKTGLKCLVFKYKNIQKPFEIWTRIQISTVHLLMQRKGN